MTKVKFLCSDNLIKGFEISGHSGYADEGQDIVCSAVSSAAYLVANTVTEIKKINAKAEDKDGYMVFLIPDDEIDDCQDLMEGMLLHVNELAKQYPDYLKVERGAYNA